MKKHHSALSSSSSSSKDDDDDRSSTWSGWCTDLLLELTSPSDGVGPRTCIPVDGRDLFKQGDSIVVQQGSGCQLYGVALSPYDDVENSTYVATVGGRRTTILQCVANGVLELAQVYDDPCAAEYLYCVVWLTDCTGEQLALATGGEQGVIRVIFPPTSGFYGHAKTTTLRGHTRAVNELAAHPTRAGILASASSDFTLRLWNVDLGCDLIIFRPIDRDAFGSWALTAQPLVAGSQVALSFSTSGEMLIAAGLDSCVRIWAIERDPKVAAKLDESIEQAKRFWKGPVDVLTVHFPLLQSAFLHKTYVDCVRFVGDDLVLSRAQFESTMTLSYVAPSLARAADFGKKAGVHIWDRHNAQIDIICRMRGISQEFWWMKFAVDAPRFRYVAGAYDRGVVLVWDLRIDDSEALEKQRPRALILGRDSNAQIRQLAFCPRGRMLIAVDSLGAVTRWDMTCDEFGTPLPPSVKVEVENEATASVQMETDGDIAPSSSPATTTSTESEENY